MKKLSIIVGHTGFIGRQLTKTLLRLDTEVLGIARTKTDFYPELTLKLDLSKDIPRNVFEGLNSLIKKFDHTTLYHLGTLDSKVNDCDAADLFDNDFFLLSNILKMNKILKRINETVVVSSVGGLNVDNTPFLNQKTYNMIKKIQNFLPEVVPKVRTVILPSVWDGSMDLERFPVKLMFCEKEEILDDLDNPFPNCSLDTAIKKILIPGQDFKIAEDTVGTFWLKNKAVREGFDHKLVDEKLRKELEETQKEIQRRMKCV